jgi:LmbE family N-acetylglucosaminyl deacetylase
MRDRKGGRPRVAVISPHLDDATFSVGSGMAAMARRGIEVHLITVLAGDGDLESPAGPWDLDTGFSTSAEAARARQQEDRRACEILGVTPIWLPYNDEQYPRGSAHEIAERLGEVLEVADTVLVPGFPLSHQDHAWVAELTLSLDLSSVRVGLYAEQPYMEGQGWPSWSNGAVHPISASPRWLPLPATVQDRGTKRAAREAYRSQLARISASSGRDWPSLRRRLDGLERSMGGELVAWVSREDGKWEPASPPAWAEPVATAVVRGWMWRKRSWVKAVRDRELNPW